MRSDLMKKGVDRIPHRSLFRALGLTDEELEQASGGFKNADGHKVKCPWCGEDREDQISYQFWATLGSSTIRCRCRSCNKYMRMYGSLCCRAEADD